MKLMADFSNRAQDINTKFKRVLEKSKDPVYGHSYTTKAFRHQTLREGTNNKARGPKITIELGKCNKKKKQIPKNNYVGAVSRDQADYVNNTIDLIGKYASDNAESVKDRDQESDLNDSRFQRRRLRNYLSCSRFSRFSNGKSLKKKRNLSTKNVNRTLTDGGVKNIRVKIPNDIRKSKFIGKALNHLEKKSKAKLYKICRSGKLENQLSSRRKSKKGYNDGKNNYSKFYEKKTGDQHEKSILRISSLIGTNISTTSPHSMLSSKDRRGEFSPKKDSSTISILKSIYKDASHNSYADDYLTNYIKKRCDTLKHRETVGSQILKNAQNARFKTLEKHKNDILSKRGELLFKDSTRTSRYKKKSLLGNGKLLKSYDCNANNKGLTKRSYNFMKNMIDDTSYRAEETDRFKKKLKKKNTTECSRDKSRRKRRKASRKRKSIAGRSSHRDNHLNNVHDIMDMLNCDEGLNSKRDDIRKRIKELKKVTKKNPFSSKMSSYNDNSVLNDYDVCKLLGIGSYSTVRLIIKKDTREKYALKIYNKMKNLDYIRKTNLENEIEFLKKHAHPNLIKLYETFSGSRNIYLMLEYVGSLSLYDFIDQKKNSRIKEMQAIHIFREMAKGIKYMHDNNFSHRDLKLDNIIIGRQRQVKLIDFGFCLESKPGEKVRLFCGTPSYMSPEILMKKPYDPKSGDIWSLGVCLYRCIAGRFPFTGSNKKKLYSNIKKGKYPILKKISKNLRSLLNGMLEPNPDLRLSINEILKNEWFNLEKQLKFYVQPRPGEE